MPSGFKQDLSIGNNLHRLRKNTNLTQDEAVGNLAKYGTNIPREILSQMENGKHSVRISILVALKEIYKTTYEEFFIGLSVEDVKALAFEDVDEDAT